MRFRKVFTVFLIVFLVLSFASNFNLSFHIEPVYAITSTLFNADLVQGNMSCVRASNTTSYAACHDFATGGNLYSATTVTTLTVGQYGSYGTYYIWRMMIPFNTSSLSGVTINSAILMLNMSIDSTTDSDFNITLDNRSATASSSFPYNPMKKGDYDKNNYSSLTTFGMLDTTPMTTTKIYYNLTFTSSGLGLINQSGMTYLLLRSDKDINNVAIDAPSSDKPQYVTLYTPQSLGGGTPVLNVTYTSVPTISALTASPTTIGYTSNFTAYCNGQGDTLLYANFTCNCTGSYASTIWALSGTTATVYLTKTLPTYIAIVAYQFGANNSAGWGYSSWTYFNTTLPSPTYTNKENLNITSYSGNTAVPVQWVQVSSGVRYATGTAGAWVGNAIASIWCRWVNFTNMLTNVSSTLYGYEFRIYDSNSSSYIYGNGTTPFSIYDYCSGDPPPQNVTSFIDNKTETRWWCSSPGAHHVTVDLGK
jgi:hypothetical protein